MAGARKLRSGTWQGWYQDHTGRRVFFTLGKTATRRQVLQAAHVLELEHAQVRQGLRPQPSAQTAALARPIAEVMADYRAWGALQGGRGRRPWALKHQQSMARYLAWWQATLHLQTLGDCRDILPRVERALQALASEGKAGNTLNQYVAALYGFLSWCRKRHYLAQHPLADLTRMPTTPRVRRRLLTVEEITRLLAACAPDHWLLYATALLTGLRANELRQLTLVHLDLDRCGLQLDAAWTKNRQPDFQPLPRALVADLYTAGRAQDHLLRVPRNTEQLIYADLARAEIPRQTPAGKVDFHALRVAYVNLVLESGATPPEAQQLARHRSVALTLSPDYGYARTRETRLHALVEGVAAKVLGTPRAPGVHAQVVGSDVGQQRRGIVRPGGQIENPSLGRIIPHNDSAFTPQPLRTTAHDADHGRGDSAPTPNLILDIPQPECAPGVHADPELDRVIAAWPTLTEDRRAAMLALLGDDAEECHD